MLPEKTWSTDAVVRLFLAVFGSLSAGFLLAAFLTKFNPGWPDERTKLVSMVVIAIAFHGAALIWIKLFLREENILWSEAFGFKNGFGIRLALLAILSALLVLPVAWVLQQLSVKAMTALHRIPESQPAVQALQQGGMSLFQQCFLGMVAIIGAPVVEELLFRGILYPTIKRSGYPKLALWGTSVLFAATHQNLPAFLPLVFFAMILTLLYEATSNLLAPIIAHSTFNIANFIMLLFAKKFTNF